MQINVAAINSEIKNDAERYIKTTDGIYNSHLQSIANDIIEHAEERPILLISGPSGSGKTTTAKMLEKLLDEAGLETHILSIDNYFKTLTAQELKLADEHKLDMESPDRVDGDFLTSQLERIIKCEEVILPKYDFIASKNVSSGITLKRKPNEIVIIEGTHSLNPKLIELSDESAAKLYISVRTRITEGTTVLHPQKIRLMRRMIRDRMYRGRNLIQTIEKYASVQRGEDLYIMPYKHRATFEADTFFPYEIGLYKSLLEQEINDLGELTETEDIRVILKAATSVDEAAIPKNSLIREFIGGGQFEY